MTNTAIDIEETLRSMADEQHARILQRFFKTGQGEYAEGDKFLGLRNPQVRSVVKETWRDCDLQSAIDLVHSQWHEVRLCGLLIMVEKFQRLMKRPIGGKENPEARTIYQTYLNNHQWINNWDLVDLTAYKIAGVYELEHPEITTLDEWIKPSHTLWQRRISMVSTWIAIRNHQYDKALERAAMLLDSKHDLLHKAVGWMLREVWKRGGKNEVEDFLEQHVHQMPSVMLSYTCELMTPQQREYWRKRRRVPQSID